MANRTAFEALWSLVGQRADAPAVLAFHKQHKLKPPPAVRTLDVVQSVGVPKLGATLRYGGKVRLPGFYPPRREAGTYVAYMVGALLSPGFAPLPGGLTPTLTLAQAKRRALASRNTSLYALLRMHAEGPRTLTFVYELRSKALAELRLGLDELDEDSPELARLAAQAQAPTRPVRKLPRSTAKPRPEPLPPPLAALRKLQEQHGLGALDFEMNERIGVGDATAWTGNPQSEHELRVFAQDGTGGLVAFWRVHEDQPLEAQPVVFLGSEGEVGPVACDLADFLYLLAGGVGPFEAVAFGTTKGEERLPQVARLAAGLARRRGRTPEAVLSSAVKQYGHFTEHIAALSQPR
jgi:hypothetical protein